MTRSGTLYVDTTAGIDRIAPNGDLVTLTNTIRCGDPYQDGALAANVELCFQSWLSVSPDERSV